MNDGEHFSAREKNAIIKYSYKDFSKPVETIYDGKSLGDAQMGEYFFNADESKVLAACGRSGIYRRSFTADYRVVDLKSGTVLKLFDEGDQMLADFSPDGSKVAFVYQNNIYFRNLETNEVSKITHDGEQNKIINGSTDWVYEEEFEITKAFYWSPDGTKIAYLKFDESGVPDFTMDYYRGGTYPSPYTFKYPKAGEANAKLTLYVYDIYANIAIEIDYGGDEYLPRMKWTKDKNELLILTMNRHQNHVKYMIVDCSKDTPEVKTIFEEKSDTWIEIDDNLLFLKNGQGFLRTSESSGYRHIYKVGFDGEVRAITSGNWDVAALKGINEKSGKVFYTSYEEGAISKHLYSIKLDGSKKTKLSTRSGTNDGSFSRGMKYYVNTHSSASSPPYISVHKSDGEEITVLVDNKELQVELEPYNLSKKEFITIKGVEHELNAWIIKPPNFDATKKYPVYFNIYNGPGANTVSDSWGRSSAMYLQLLAQKGYIIISVDTRGTGRRGT
ncbi:DPP IV N-terminal domain-containing protein, partial [bacterium AH-315-B15]|nr:DPP IV N-terminal domain-containing protein [bacterium AH-315-B15]